MILYLLELDMFGQESSVVCTTRGIGKRSLSNSCSVIYHIACYTCQKTQRRRKLQNLDCKNISKIFYLYKQIIELITFTWY